MIKKIFLDRKGNAIALVFMFVISLAAGLLYTQHLNNPIDTLKSRQNTIVTESDIAIRRGIALGISDFLLNGFSNKNRVWYCNYPYPPYLDESNGSLHEMTSARVESYLDALRDKGYTLQRPEITFDIVSMNLAELKLNSITATTNNFIIGTETDELIEKQDLSNSYTFDWPVWLLYTNFISWIEDNAGDLTGEIYREVFEGKSCQAVSSSCQCPNGRMIKKEIIEDMRLKLDDVYPALNNSLQKLNERFAETDITCLYKIDKYHIENIDKFDYSYSMSTYLNEETDVVEWDTIKYVYDYSHYLDEFSLPSPGKDALGGCPTFNQSIDATLREKRTNFETTIKETEYIDYESENCTNSEELYLVKNELFAIDKKLGLLVTFSCSDPKISIETEEGLKPLTAAVQLRVAVRLDCPLPDKEEISSQKLANGEEPYTCGGGSGSSCFSAGTKIATPFGEKNIEDIKIGDYVYSYDTEENRYLVSSVLELEAPVREGIYIINDDLLRITDEHPIYTKKENGIQGWAAIDPIHSKLDSAIEYINKLEIGDRIFMMPGEWVKIYSIEYDHGEIQTYNLKRIGHNNFFADNFLVHNKGVIVEGPILCNFPHICSECEICVPDKSEPDGYTCLPVPLLVPCSGLCMACDGNGECNMPIPRGIPDECGKFGNCMVCDGEKAHMGTEEACILGNEGMAEFAGMVCDGSCYMCDYNGECNKIPDDFTKVDSSFCGECMSCGLEGGIAKCVANPEDNGEFNRENECKVCMDGVLVDASDGAKDPNFCGKCEVCRDGICGYNDEFSPSLLECDKCLKCGEINGEVACVPDPTQNAKVCGGNGCSVCTDGICGGSKLTEGQLCASDSGCETRCDGNGKCVDGSGTFGNSCKANIKCYPFGKCNEKGKCVGSLPEGKQCCGDLLCNSGDPCCENGLGIGKWTCEACDDGTT